MAPPRRPASCAVWRAGFRAATLAACAALSGCRTGTCEPPTVASIQPTLYPRAWIDDLNPDQRRWVEHERWREEQAGR